MQTPWFTGNNEELNVTRHLNCESSGAYFGEDVTIGGDLTVGGENVIAKINAVESDLQSHTHTTIENDLTVDGNINITNGKELSLTGFSESTGYGPTLVLGHIKFANHNSGTKSAFIRMANESSKNLMKFAAAGVTFEQGLTAAKTATFKGDVTMNTNLTIQGTDILAKITQMEAILQNHYQALMLLLEKHDMVDTDTTDENNITAGPKETPGT